MDIEERLSTLREAKKLLEQVVENFKTGPHTRYVTGPNDQLLFISGMCWAIFYGYLITKKYPNIADASLRNIQSLLGMEECFPHEVVNYLCPKLKEVSAEFGGDTIREHYFTNDSAGYKQRVKVINKLIEIYG